MRASETQVARMVTRMKYSKGWGRVQTQSQTEREGEQVLLGQFAESNLVIYSEFENYEALV